MIENPEKLTYEEIDEKYIKYYEELQEKNKQKKRRRCFQRVISGIQRGGRLRFITLTSSDVAPADIQKSWKILYKRLRRRNLIKGYIKVIEFTKAGRPHLHILFRGSYIEQALLSAWWQDIHKSYRVDIREMKTYGRGKKGKRITHEMVANYMSKYMSKEGAGRYSWSWGWVWPGFCRHWEIYKRYWWRHFYVKGKTTFNNCLTGWKLWLQGVYKVDIEAMIDGYPPGVVFSIA